MGEQKSVEFISHLHFGSCFFRLHRFPTLLCSAFGFKNFMFRDEVGLVEPLACVSGAVALQRLFRRKKVVAQIVLNYPLLADIYFKFIMDLNQNVNYRKTML